MIFILYLKCNNPLFQFLQDYVLDCAIHILTELCTSAMNMKFRNLQLSADFNIQYNSLEILKLGEV